MSIYRQYLESKTVVIVGPASSIVGTRQCNKIDSYDVVVRINDALPVPEELVDDIGTRTDVLYSNMNPNLTKYGNYRSINNIEEIKKLRWVCAPVPLVFPPTKVNIGNNPHMSQRQYLKKQAQYHDQFRKKMSGFPFHVADSARFAEFVDAVGGGLPNTGLAAINDLLDQPIAELYVTGFTFFKGGYYKQYDNCPLTEEQVIRDTPVGYDTGLHQINPQRRYLKKLISENARITIDKPLRDVLFN
jgi:hypothetical protein